MTVTIDIYNHGYLYLYPNERKLAGTPSDTYLKATRMTYMRLTADRSVVKLEGGWIINAEMTMRIW